MDQNPFSSNASQPSPLPVPTTQTCSCGKRLLIKPEHRGKKVKCPGCQKILLIAGAATATQAFNDSVSNVDASQATIGGATQRLRPLTEFLSPPQAADEIGRLGGYRVLTVLGHGGMGVVYKGEDPRLGRFVALKAMLPAVAAAATAKERFFREARAAAALKHDHIVSIFQVGEDRGVPFLAMEFLEGESLDDRLKRDVRLPIAEAVRIGREVALGLAAAHKRGLIHRDIKPANIWLEAETGRAKILDFGLARGDSLGGTEANQLTQSGMIIGTPAYMPPEQAGGKKVDARCDLYSLGVVLYRMSTGEMPIKGEDAISLLSALALDTPTEPWLLNKDMPTELNDLIVRLLAKNPDERPGNAQETADAIHAIAAATPDDRIRVSRQQPRRPNAAPVPAARSLVLTLPRDRRAAIFAGIGGVVFASLIVAGFFFLPHPLPHDPVKVPVKVNGPPPQPIAGESAFDRLDRKDIPPRELKIAGNGDPANAASELVAILGDSRFQHPDTRGANHNDLDHIAVSPDGKSIESVSGEFAVRIWDSSTGELLQILPFALWPRQLVISSEGTLYATQPSNDILAWDPRTGKNRRVPFQHRGAVGISFSRDGATVVTSGDDGTHRVSSAADGREILTISADLKTVSVLSPDAGLVAFVKYKTLRLWNVVQNKDDGIIADLAMEPQSWHFTPDGRTLLVRFEDRAVVCDLKQRKRTDQFKRDRLLSISISPDSRFVATCGWGASFEVWDLAEGVIHAKMQGEANSYNRVAFFPDGKRVASLDWGLRVRVWDLTGKSVSPPGESNLVRYIRATPDGVITVGVAIRAWDLATCKSRLLGKWMYAGQPEVSPEGRKIAFNTGNPAAYVLDVQSGELRTLPVAHPGSHIAASPDWRRLGLGCDDSATVWDMPAAEKSKSFPFAARCLTLTDDGNLVGASHPKLAVYDLKTEKTLWTHENRFPLDMRASRDGKLLAMTQYDGGPNPPTLILELATGKTLHELPLAERLSFSPDGRKLATLAADGVTIWNTQTGKREHQIGFGLDKAQVDLDFAPDGRHLVVANGNGTVSIFRLTNP